MGKVFISYCHVDVEKARQVHEALRAVGVECWRDERWLRAGDDFAEEITRAIRDSEGLVLLLSQASNASDYVAIEVALAHHFHKRVLPILLEPAPISDRLLPYVVRAHQLDLADGTEAVARSVKQRLSKPGTPETTRPPSIQPGAAPAPAVNARASFVTIGQYREFVQASGRRQMPAGDLAASPAGDTDDLPVTSVSWDEAVAYCDWAGARLPAPGDLLSLAGPAAMGETTILEWWDAGTESHRQVRDPRTAGVAALLERGVRRVDIGFRVAEVKAAEPSQWVQIPAGRWLLGADAAAFGEVAGTYRLHHSLAGPIVGRLASQQQLGAYAIARTCVTNEEYYAFTKATCRRWPAHWSADFLGRSAGPYPARVAGQPVVNVSAEDAATYCAWSRTRLPSWAEWERAAAGPDRNRYPWGVGYDTGACNSVDGGRGALVQVDDYPAGDSPDGVRQLCGNVAEWVLGPNGHTELRGGSYRVPCELWGLAYVFRRADSWECCPDVGFRVAAR